jgi:hypothetical protein
MFKIKKDFIEDVVMSKCTNAKCGRLFWVQSPMSNGRYVDQIANHCYMCGSVAIVASEKDWEYLEDEKL